MKFGSFPVRDCQGAIAAHSVRRDGALLKKGEIVGPVDIARLEAAGVAEIIVAVLEAGDVGEDAAALALARAVAGPNLRIDAPFTGRANLFSTANGVLALDAATIDAVNAIDERVTLATLPPMRAVVEGEMVATVKIIPFAVPGAVLDAAIAAAGNTALGVAAFEPLRIGVISTLLPGLKPSVVEKTLRVLDSRLAPMGTAVMAQAQVAHETGALAHAIATMAPGCDLLIVFGASAITDRRDVIPLAIEAAGGRIGHFGMPVDPGNLLLLAQMPGGPHIVGAPGCARSPKENGFDFVLQRMVARVPVSGADIRRMGAGGLLMEIVSRPQPRLGAQATPADE